MMLSSLDNLGDCSGRWRAEGQERYLVLVPMSCRQIFTTLSLGAPGNKFKVFTKHEVDVVYKTQT